MIRKVLLTSFLTSLFLLISVDVLIGNAAVKTNQVIQPLKPLVKVVMGCNNNCDVSEILTNNSSSNPQVIALGNKNGSNGSNGFISAYNQFGQNLWNLDLIVSKNEIVNSVISLKNGNYLVVGAGNTDVANSSTTFSLPAGILNPDNLDLNMINAINSNTSTSIFNNLEIFEVSSKGELIDTHTLQISGTIAPQNIVLSSDQINEVTITGQILLSKVLSNFSLNYQINTDPGITDLQISPSNLTSQSLSLEQNFKTIYGSIEIYQKNNDQNYFPYFHPKRTLPIIVEKNKMGKVVAARYLLNNIIETVMNAKRNLFFLTSDGKDYWISFYLGGANK